MYTIGFLIISTKKLKPICKNLLLLLKLNRFFKVGFHDRVKSCHTLCVTLTFSIDKKTVHVTTTALHDINLKL